MTVSGRTVAENHEKTPSLNREVIYAYDKPLKQQAGFLALKGNLFDAGLIKTCVVSDDFRSRYPSEPGNENVFVSRVIVFEGPEDYRARINDPALGIDDSCMLAIRGCGPIGYPGSGEVVNMQPLDYLEGRHSHAADDGGRTPERHIGQSEHPEHCTRVDGRGTSRCSRLTRLGWI